MNVLDSRSNFFDKFENEKNRDISVWSLFGNSSVYNNAYKKKLRNNGVYNPLKYEPKSESLCATPLVLVLERSKKQTCRGMLLHDAII